MKQSDIKAWLKQENGSEKLSRLSDADTITEVLDLVSSLSVIEDKEKVLAPALAFLIREGKQKAAREVIAADAPDLEALLRHSDPKVRKNAARLIGTLGMEKLDLALIRALEEESTRMVRPSLVLALGSLGTEKAAEILKQYQVEEAMDASEEKHVREEKEALRKALRQIEKETVSSACMRKFLGLQGLDKKGVELRTERGFEEALASEIRIKQAADKILSVRPGTVVVTGTSVERLQMVRSWREWLLPLGRVSMKASEKEQVQSLSAMLISAMEVMYGGEEAGAAPFRFRLETGKREGTAALAARIEEAGNGRLLNAPGNYECELRIYTLSKTEKLSVLLKVSALKDQRYQYRMKAIPASIHPSGAAGLMQMAAPYMKAGARVMDPCCGSGTLLLERAMMLRKKPEMLMGSDLSESALTACKENMLRAKELGLLKATKVKLSKKDMRELTTECQVDELYANLPFGNRVGNHKENEGLYRELYDYIPSWVKPGGIALLYSMEGKLLLKEAERCKGKMEVLFTRRVEAGGLEPTVVLLRVKE